MIVTQEQPIMCYKEWKVQDQILLLGFKQHCQSPSCLAFLELFTIIKRGNKFMITSLSKTRHVLDSFALILKKQCIWSILLDLRSHKSQVCRLNKAIYGLKQAPRQWFDKLNTNFFEAWFSFH
ncbi:hypothetical protein V8G54_031731 [Vigna mungo]|uniref:Reverse transcriptase Ty1/copia-type domain-containing protein n=1 Tax=Vigna mungo TaxID=3915 RepID=A0AAQ3RET0_VIGMU